MVAQVSLLMNTSSTIDPKGKKNKYFEEFYTDSQTLLNKCQYEDCCKPETRMSYKEHILLARSVAGIRSNEVRKSILCIKDLTLEKAVQHVSVDEATSFHENQFSSEIKKTAASLYLQDSSDNNPYRNSASHSDSQENNPRKCRFSMRVHVFRKELYPAKPKTTGPDPPGAPTTLRLVQGEEERKLDAHPAKSSFPGNPALQCISADAKS